MHNEAWVFLIEAVVIVTANIVSMVIFTRTPRLRRRNNILIINLCIADLLVGLVSVPLYTSIKIDENLLKSETFANIFKQVDRFCASSSLFGLAVVAIERVYATYNPFRHRTQSIWKYKIGISIAWASAFAITLALFLIDRYFDSPDKVKRLVTSICTSVIIVVPITIVLISYLLIWLRVLRRNISRHETRNSNAKLNVTLAIVTLVSLITWMPFMIVSVLVGICEYIKTCSEMKKLFSNSPLLDILKFLHYGNSFVNFIVYIARMPEFRKEIVRRVRNYSKRYDALSRSLRNCDETMETKL